MRCIPKILEIKGDKEFLAIPEITDVVVEGGGNYKEYDYIITFLCQGYRCGYVAINDGKYYEVDDISVHGGITFEGSDHYAKMLLDNPCTEMWIGFDACHYGDGNDFKTAKKYFCNNTSVLSMIKLLNGLYSDYKELPKSYKYMENECKNVIDQLIEQDDKRKLLNQNHLL